MINYKNKTLLITGGTGSFGNAVLTKYLNSDFGEIRIFSRDEDKQHNLKPNKATIESTIRQYYNNHY